MFKSRPFKAGRNFALFKLEGLVIILSKTEIQNELKRSRINPLYKIETFFKERKLKKEKKVLQLQLAIVSGGITRMK